METLPETLSEAEKRITLHDVARLARVSVTTVSRVLNDKAEVRPSTRERVLAAIEATAYRPDLSAQSMRTGGSKSVGLLVSDISNPLFARIAVAAEAVFNAAGYALVVFNSGFSSEHESGHLTTLLQRRSEGVIAAPSNDRMPAIAEQLSQLRAVVLLDRSMIGTSFDAVLTDHATGVREAVERLAGLGHKRIALIVGPSTQRGNRVRLAAFTSVSQSIGGLTVNQFVTPQLDQTAGYAAANALLDLDSPPTAIIACSNQLTVGILRAVQETRLRIPEDISIVGADDTEVTELHSPPIDVINRDIEKVGRSAARLFLDRVAAPDREPQVLTVPTELVVRSSSGPPRWVHR